MIAFAMKEGFVPVIGTGRTEWDHIHVHDLAALFVKLVDATQDPKLSSDPEIFGNHGYFFCENGPFAWGDVAKCENPPPKLVICVPLPFPPLHPGQVWQTTTRD